MKSLYLNGNQLTTLPESIGGLTALTSLDLSDNRLTALPESIGGLTALTSLYLFRNRLTTLPESIGGLTALTSLYLFCNRLTALPESIVGLTALTNLYLSFNQLTALPESIGGLTALTSLYLNGNQLTTLPESIDGLNALKLLDLSLNQLTPSPTLLDRLSELETRGCQIDYPDQITLQLRVDRAESRRSQKSRLQLELRTLLLSSLDDKSNFSKLDDEILKKIAEFTDTSLLSEAEIEAAFEAAEEGVKQTERYKKHVDANSTANNQESETKSVTASPAEVIVSEEVEEGEHKSDYDEELRSPSHQGAGGAAEQEVEGPTSGERAEEPGGFATRRTFEGKFCDSLERAEEPREVTTARRTFMGRVCDAFFSIFPKPSISTTENPAQQLQSNNPLHHK